MRQVELSDADDVSARDTADGRASEKSRRRRNFGRRVNGNNCSRCEECARRQTSGIVPVLRHFSLWCSYFRGCVSRIKTALPDCCKCRFFAEKRTCEERRAACSTGGGSDQEPAEEPREVPGDGRAELRNSSGKLDKLIQTSSSERAGTSGFRQRTRVDFTAIFFFRSENAFSINRTAPSFAETKKSKLPKPLKIP